MQYMPSAAFQAVSLMYSAGLGFALGIVYDLFRIFFYLITGSDKKFLLFRDIIYLLVCLAASFLFILVVCNGRLILYIFMGMAAGLAVYFYSVSDSVFLPIKKKINCIRRHFSKFKNHITQIRTRFITFLKKIRKKLYKNLFFSKKDLQIRHNIVYNHSVKLRLRVLNLMNRGDEGGKSEEK